MRQETGKSQLLVINESPALVDGMLQWSCWWRSSSSANHSSNLPLPVDLGPDLMKYTFLVQQHSLACRLPGGLCIHQIRTKAEWAFAFENPLVFYFLLAFSVHLLGKKCFVAGRFAVSETVQNTLRGLVSWPFSSFRLCCGRIGSGQRDDLVRTVDGKEQVAAPHLGATLMHLADFGASIVLPLQG